MKTNLLLTLMLMVAFSTAMSAQDMEQTASPHFNMGYNEEITVHDYMGQRDCNIFLSEQIIFVETIDNLDDDDATIYYRFADGASEWVEYSGGSLDPVPMGIHYTQVEAYAQAEGKLPSDIVSTEVYYLVYFVYSACFVDGMHFIFDTQVTSMDDDFLDATDVYVCSMYDSQINSQPYSGDIVVPKEIVYMDRTYAVTKIYNKAFASTFFCPCNITSVELPSTITEVCQSAFAGCVNLNRMVVHAVTPPYAFDIFYYVDENYSYYDYIGFDGNTLYDQVTLFVPYESIEEYRAAWEWGQFTHIVPFIGAGPGDINGDGNIAINDVTNLIDQLLGGEEIPAYCDVDGDGNVTIKDVTALIDQLLSGN